MAGRTRDSRTGPPASGRAEWRSGAGLVLAAFFGVSIAAIESRAIGVLIKPLSESFGWTRTQISAAPLLLSIGTLTMSPIMGGLVDRWGARRVALTGVPLFGALLAALSLSGGDLGLFYALFALTTLVGPAVGPMTWSLAVASRFHAQRGLALGISMSGIAALGTVTPLFVTLAYEELGIHLVWVALGLYAFAVAFPLAWFLFYDARDLERRNSEPAASAASRRSRRGDGALQGLTLGQALRASRFWRLAFGIIVAAGVCGLFSVHFVSMFTDRGVTAREAALLFGAMGPATMVGRIVGGLLLDRLFAPFVAAATLLLPLAACLLMLLPGSSLGFGLTIAVLVGFTLGSEGDTVAYLASRYFGLRSYGTIYGALFGLYGLGFGAGSFAGGAMFDATGSYGGAWMLFVLLLLPAIALLATLGRFPDFTPANAAAQVSGQTGLAT
jgi:predicted MFS family arabinose efflux permease